jgi:peptidoglycan/xylan/chitin deacetylase (PgdA/CDA1 family)
MVHDIFHKLKKINQRKTVILMYHQVCERKNDPWELAVCPKHFQAQLEYLKENFNVVPMADLAGGIERHAMKKSVALTFDDGFKDNYSNAAPVLDWLEIPATFYVSTTAVRDQKLYWWDALQYMIFHSRILPRDFEMVINGETMQFNFHSDHVLTNRLMNQIRAWNYNLPIPNERIALYMLLWHAIKLLSYTHQHEVLARICDWAGCKDFSYPDGMTMTVSEMQMLSQHPLFSIGAHSVHHAMLSHQNAVDQAYEVKESKRQIETWLRKSINGFAYPYGNYNAVTQQLLKESGFLYAVSTEPKPVTWRDDPFALPRIQVKNWSVYEFASRLNKMINE